VEVLGDIILAYFPYRLALVESSEDLFHSFFARILDELLFFLGVPVPCGGSTVSLDFISSVDYQEQFIVLCESSCAISHSPPPLVPNNNIVDVFESSFDELHPLVDYLVSSPHTEKTI